MKWIAVDDQTPRAELEGPIRRDLVGIFQVEQMTDEEARVAISPTRYAFPRAPRFSIEIFKFWAMY